MTQPVRGLPDGSEPASQLPDGSTEGASAVGSPDVELARLINDWHQRSLASYRLTASGVRKWLVLVGLMVDGGPERGAGQQGIPATGGERCNRCGRKLQFIHRVGGRNYGRICATKGVTR